MNRLTDYQSAWNRLVNRDYKYADILSVYNDLEILRPLVEKSTPKKVEKSKPLEDDVTIGKAKFCKGTTLLTKCPICDAWLNLLYHKKYCGKCGQALDWGENDE